MLKHGLIPALAAVLLAAGPLDAQSGATTESAGTVDFAGDVLPILRQRCFQCHGGGRKPKAGLRLDGRDWILAGGVNGRVLTTGKPAGSPLYALTILPGDDPDIMPAKGAPLTKAETDRIRTWIEEGAAFGDWTGAPGPGSAAPATKVAAQAAASARRPSRLRELEALGEGLTPLPAASIRKAAGELGRITPSLSGSPLLRVEFVSHESEVTDAQVKALAAIADRIAILDLARTRVTDAALRQVSRMKRLTRLDLHETGVGDRGVAELKGLQHLRSLNLYGTKVTDGALENLAALPALRSLYLWKTKVSSEGVEALSAQLPDLRIRHELVLPEPAPPQQRNRGRR